MKSHYGVEICQRPTCFQRWLSPDGFADCDGVIYRLDSSSGRSDLNTKLTVSNFSGSYTVPSREFVYTNATFQGGTIQPDIRQLGGELSESNQAGFYLLALFLLVVVAIKLFRAG